MNGVELREMLEEIEAGGDCLAYSSTQLLGLLNETREIGYSDGFSEGHDEGYETGVEDGQERGYQEGYDQGYADGQDDAEEDE